MKGISVCMIVKNEERFLEQCLNSIKNLADEIIIADTGSTDRTKEIARKFTDKIFDYEWKNDFSEARNFSLSKATKDWILSIDADEVISPLDFDKIRNLTEKPEANAYFSIWRDYTNESGQIGWQSSEKDIYPESKKANGYAAYSTVRLFQNFKGYKFQGKIHEIVENSIKEQKGTMFLSSIVIHHFGNIMRKKGEIFDKKEKYSNMLKEKLSSEDDSGKEKFFVLFELARELMIKKDFDGAKDALEKSISFNPDFADSLSVLSSIKIMEKKFDEAETLLKRAVGLNPLDSDIHANLGVIYSEQGNFQKAVRKFGRAIELNSMDADNYFNLGIVYLRMKKKDKAMHFFEKAIELNPKYSERIRFN